MRMRVSASSAPNGSSSSSRSGSRTRARASAARWRLAARERLGPVVARARRGRPRRARRDPRSRRDAPARAEHDVVEHRAPTAAGAGPGTRPSGRSGTTIAPSTPSSSPARARSSVLLPEPLAAQQGHELAAVQRQVDAAAAPRGRRSCAVTPSARTTVGRSTSVTPARREDGHRPGCHAAPSSRGRGRARRRAGRAPRRRRGTRR